MFYIKKIFLTGKRVETASLNFTQGLNIIYGPSNTGKSYVVECFDFMFGSKKTRIDPTIGYEYMHMIISTQDGDITFVRKLDSTKIEVSSLNPIIESGDYNINAGNRNISFVWLKLMGIMEPHKIICSKQFKVQQLTLRTFYHMFFIKESSVFQEHSILLPIQNTARPPAQTALLFLLTGCDFRDKNHYEDKKIKEAKKKAVVNYINNRLSGLAERKLELLDKNVMDAGIIQEKIDSILTEITEAEGEVSVAVARSKELANEIYKVNEKLAECNMLHGRYQVLQSQYAADIKRLTFIAEGELHKGEIPKISKCPFCKGELTKQDETSCVEAAQAEVIKILSQIKDLEDAEKDLWDERITLLNNSQELSEERSFVEERINAELRPRVAALRQSLAQYRSSIEIQKETNVIWSFEESMKEELYTIETEEELKEVFNILEHFDDNFIRDFNTLLTTILETSHFDNFSSVYFNLKSFDLVVNGKEKDTYGKGYRAFLNTVLALALMDYLSNNGKFAPNMLIIDSPILSLKEKGSEKASDSMKSSLFQYMIDNQQYGQTIIIENEIPELDYGSANMIHFTKDELEGRYGFLKGVR